MENQEQYDLSEIDLAAFSRELAAFLQKDAVKLRTEGGDQPATVRSTHTFTLKFRRDTMSKESNMGPRLCCIRIMSSEGLAMCHGRCC
jgi:hypothetical protein